MRSTDKHILAENDVGKLLIKLSIPSTIGMFVMSSFNVVDTIFVGRGVGMLGIAGVAICFPVQILVLAIAQLFGMGGASIISRAIGTGDLAKVNKTFGNVVFSTTILSFMVAIPGLIFINTFAKFLGATPDVMPYAIDYLSIILLGTVFRCFAISSNNIIRSEGRAKISMTLMIIAAILNVILDPIFIFVLDMGVKGAAIATVISQFAVAIYALAFFNSEKSIIQFKRIKLKPDFKIIREIVSIGMASLGRNLSSSALIIIMNNVFAGLDFQIGIAIYGIINRVIFLFSTPIMGVSQGLQPIVGFNFGAKRFDKVTEVVKKAYIRAVVISLFTFTIVMLFPNQIINLFSNDPNLIESGVPAFRKVVLLFPMIGLQMMGGAYFQAIGKAFKAFVLTLSRQAIVLIPLILILPKFLGIDGVFWSFPIADFSSAIITYFFVSRSLKSLARTNS
ncbi:MATE family efflux transporter [bacterium]|nr:MATE family efflux transporter [bacterium]